MRGRDSTAIRSPRFRGAPVAAVIILAKRVGETDGTMNETAVTSTAMDISAGMNEQERELAELIVSTLNLEISAAEIDPQAALYGEGLGLDSIDILEVALAISKTYGVQIRSDDSDNVNIFRSLRSLNEHVQRQRQRSA